MNAIDKLYMKFNMATAITTLCDDASEYIGNVNNVKRFWMGAGIERKLRVTVHNVAKHVWKNSVNEHQLKWTYAELYKNIYLVHGYTFIMPCKRA